MLQKSYIVWKIILLMFIGVRDGDVHPGQAQPYLLQENIELMYTTDRNGNVLDSWAQPLETVLLIDENEGKHDTLKAYTYIGLSREQTLKVRVFTEGDSIFLCDPYNGCQLVPADTVYLFD